jgi:3-oxoacyl-(acyl-carrier-protein) synthase
MTVAIVARAWRTPLGDSIDAAMARLLAGERAAIANPRVPPGSYACSLVAPIVAPPAPSRQARFLRRMGLHALEVAREAVASAGAMPDRPRVGLFSGVGGLRAHWDDMLSALANQQPDGARAWERGLGDIHPYWMLRHLSNNAHALASVELGLRGEGATFGGATAGAQAIAAASRALVDGAIDAAVVVAYDSLLEPETLVELAAKRAATHAISPPPPAYDERAAGFVPGEAAAALVLVRVEDAGDRALANIAAVDGADGARAEPSPRTLARVLSTLVAGRADHPDERDAEPTSIAGADRLRDFVVDGAARAWPELDAAERVAIARAIGDVPLTAITSSMGQLGAATSIVQAIALAEALRRGVVPPIAGLASTAPVPLHPVAARTSTRATTAFALATGAPGLAAAIRVEVRR